MPEVPSIDAGEITDKGYINQRRAFTMRHQYVVQLYEGVSDPAVITLPAQGSGR